MKTRIFTIILALFAIATTAQAAITCSKPTELTATEITANSVKLSWTENGEATAWEIQYSTDADNIDEGTTILVTENPYTLTGLTAQTTYYARVRAVCGEGDYSNWSPTATFTTEVKNLVNVTVTAKPTEGGTVTGGGDYAEGTEVTVTATPKEGYVFSYWYDGKNIIRDANHTFTITENVTLTAYFDKLVNITVTASPADGGTVTGSGIYKAGSMVPVTATANPGYVFVGWYDGDKLKSYNACYDVPVGSSDKNLTARFLRVQVNVVDEDGYPVDAGVYTVRLEVDQGFMFGYSYTGLMVRVQIDYPGSDWVITRIEGAYSSFGTNPLWTDIVDGGGNQDLYSDFGRYDFTMPDGPVTITVTLYQLLPKYFWIALNASPREGGDVFGGGNHFLPGEPAELIAFPNPGYQFVGWTENGEQVSTDNPYIFPVTGYRTLTAVFAKLYPLWVGDTQVDSSNKDNILGAIDPATNEPTAAYDPDTKTLTLHNPTISGAYQDYKIYSEDSLTIEGTATITGDKGIAVVSEKEELNTLTIQNAELDISAQWEAIYARNTHVCMNSGTVNAASALHRAVNVQVHGSFTMNGGELVIDSDMEGLMVWRGNQQAYVDGENNIVINGGRIDAKSVTNTPIKAHGVVTLPAAYYAHLYGGDTPLSLEHVELNDNYGIYYNSCFVDESGERITGDRIVIEPKPIAKYYLWIGDTQVDEANKDDIPGVTGENAKASFDPATNTLTLENVTGVTGSTMGALITAEGINLTVEGSAVLEDKNIDMGIQVAPGSLTLDGDFTISAGSYGIYVQKDVTMVKGSLFAKGKAACGIYSARETLKVNGGTLEAMGSMCALGTVPDFSGYTGEYEVLVNENYNAEGASQWSGDDVNDPLGGFSSSYKYVKIIPILIPTLVLLDDDSEADSKNQELIQANLGEQVGKVNVMLEGRTIYRDGRWNTVCLPFNLEDSDDSDGKNCTGTLFEGAIVKRFDSSSYTPKTKTLTLNFEDSESIWTGGPYLVRWDSSENLEDLVNPVFKNVEIIDGEPLPDTSDCIDFLGCYSPVSLAAQDRTVLYLGGDSKLYYPGVDVPVNAFRGYFQLKNGLTAGDLPTNGAKNFVLNFGDSTTEIGASLNDNGQWINDNFYSIDGRKLQGEPTQKGVYIQNGKKIVK